MRCKCGHLRSAHTYNMKGCQERIMGYQCYCTGYEEKMKVYK